MEIIKNKLDKMESLYAEQWRRLSEIANNGNLDLLIEQTETLKKTYAKIVTLEVLYGECVGAYANSEGCKLPIPRVSGSLPDLKKEVINLFNKYFEYVYTTDDGEQIGEWKHTFADKIIELFTKVRQ